MSDLIRREDVIKSLQIMMQDCFPEAEEELDAVVTTVKEIPSAEPERKIIYCKDCRFAHLTIKGEVKYCDVWFPEEKTYFSADDFCSSAEKRGE